MAAGRGSGHASVPRLITQDNPADHLPVVQARYPRQQCCCLKRTGFYLPEKKPGAPYRTVARQI
jgi:hypothetical protein